MVADPGFGDRRLVAAVRRGDDRAFELLYSRYQRRIHAYVLGMVKDHGRAEDVTQEVFVSALRRMRQTERPIAFKPWVYEIAKNACIDQFRRSRRAEEVSLQADDGLAPSDYGKLVGSEPTPEAAVAAKQDLAHLCGAFGGLSETHHEILVMRELEGLSYREIGERLGMSRAAVESTLFRARRRLSEEYDDLVTGARCKRIHGLIQSAVTSRLGTRESRRLTRHVAHCQPCRREALAAGLDAALLTPAPLRKRAATKIGALLPFPLFGRGRGGDGGGWAAQLPMLAEQTSGGWGKLATAAIVLVAGVGAAGVGTQVADSEGEPPARGGAAVERGAAAPAKKSVRPAGGSAPGERAERAAKGPRRPERARNRAGRRGAADSSGSEPAATSGGDKAATGGTLPAVAAPAPAGEPAAPVRETVETVEKAAQPVTGAVEKAAQPVTGAVEQTAQGAVGTVEEATAPVQPTVDKVGGAVEDTTGVQLPPLP